MEETEGVMMLVKHLVTSHLVHAETEGCNRRACAVLNFLVKRW